MEATRCPDRVANDQVIAAYRSEVHPGSTSIFTRNAVAAGDSDFVDFASILDGLRPLAGWTVDNSPSVTDAELDDRVAINDRLLGVDRSSFEARQHSYFENVHLSRAERDRLLPLRVAARLAAYDRVIADLPAALRSICRSLRGPSRGHEASLPPPGLDAHRGRTDMGRLGAHRTNARP